MNPLRIWKDHAKFLPKLSQKIGIYHYQHSLGRGYGKEQTMSHSRKLICQKQTAVYLTPVIARSSEMLVYNSHAKYSNVIQKTKIVNIYGYIW